MTTKIFKSTMHPRETYESLVRDTILNPKDKIALPDRKATLLRSTQQLNQWDDERFLNLDDEQKVISEQRAQAEHYRQADDNTGNSHHANNHDRNQPPPPAYNAPGPPPPPPNVPRSANSYRLGFQANTQMRGTQAGPSMSDASTGVRPMARDAAAQASRDMVDMSVQTNSPPPPPPPGAGAVRMAPPTSSKAAQTQHDTNIDVVMTNRRDEFSQAIAVLDENKQTKRRNIGKVFYTHLAPSGADGNQTFVDILMRDAQAHRKPDPLVVYTNHTPSPGGGGGGAIRMGVSDQSTKASKSRRVETEPQGSSALVLHMKNNAMGIDARSGQGKPPPGGGGAGAIRQASGTMETRVPRPIGRAGRIPKAGAGAPPPKVVTPMETLVVVPHEKAKRGSGSLPKKDEVKIVAGPTPKPIDTTPKRPNTDGMPASIKKLRPSAGPPLPREPTVKPSRAPRKPSGLPPTRKPKASNSVKPSKAPPMEEEEIVSPPKPSGRPAKKVKPSTPPEKPVSPPNPVEPPPKKPRTKDTAKPRLRQKTGPTLPPPNRITAKMLKSGFGDTIVAMNFEKAALAEIQNIVAQMQEKIPAAKTRSLTKRAKEIYGEHYRSQRIKV